VVTPTSSQAKGLGSKPIKPWKRLPFVLASLGALAWPVSSLATPELPCIREVCVGDSLDRLKGIDWQPVNYSLKRLERMGKALRARRTRTYEGFDGDETPAFVILREFDGSTLDNLSNIRTACEPNEMVGTFISGGGHKTQVHVSLLPEDDAGRMNGQMRWRVKAITRLFRSLDSRQQRERVFSELNARYGKFSSAPKPGEGGYLLAPAGKDAVVTLFLGEGEYLARFKRNAYCGTPSKISID